MKFLKKDWATLLLLIIILLTVSYYCLYRDFQDRQAYESCLHEQSLDVTKQDAIQEYCREVMERINK